MQITSTDTMIIYYLDIFFFVFFFASLDFRV